jgi:hypothetical protein
MSIADRGNCALTATCEQENSNRVLLGINGVFQGLGALSLLAGFMVPETHTVYEPVDVGSVKLRVAPASFGKAAPGIAVFGEF